MRQNMDINQNNLLDILNKNFSYEFIDSILGKGILLSPEQAFIYCNITGSGYLTNKTFPYSPKGLMKVFHTACEYDMVTGIFDNFIFKYTPKKISELHPYIFSGNKILITLEVNSEQEYYKLLELAYNRVLNAGLLPADFIIQRVECTKKGNGMEPFMEFLSCEKFKEFGYITENQVPLGHSLGSPDFMAFKLGNLKTGFHLIELSMLFINKHYDDFLKTHENLLSDLTVGEAKTSTTIMSAQIEKYINTGFYDQAFEIHPSKIETTSNAGLIFLDNSLTLNIKKSKSTRTNTETQKLYKGWLFNYIKIHLLANLSDEELIKSYDLFIGRTPTSKSEFYKFIQLIDIEYIINSIKKD